jgi:hypothetical protein
MNIIFGLFTVTENWWLMHELLETKPISVNQKQDVKGEAFLSQNMSLKLNHMIKLFVRFIFQG